GREGGASATEGARPADRTATAVRALIRHRAAAPGPAVVGEVAAVGHGEVPAAVESLYLDAGKPAQGVIVAAVEGDDFGPAETELLYHCWQIVLHLLLQRLVGPQALQEPIQGFL